MDIKNFFSKIIKGNNTVSPPSTVENSFNKRFQENLNPEWSINGNYYEAVFYLNELEHIAQFEKTGEPVSVKINLPLSQLPANFKGQVAEHGELMNLIEIQNQDTILYELIVRDQSLIRYFLLIDSSGQLQKKIKL